ncbi:hypothetical protein V6N13_036084 [Hibiscus sabdariffa]|uniref:C3H1-type domain-containing protein n=1 Tax=Hibiscus sabdariffa TaxID=183260 RepID=A0ABR2S7H4_9ROSI
MSKNMDNPNVFDFAEQQVISNFNLAQEQAQAQALSLAKAQAQAQARAQTQALALAQARAQAEAKYNEAIDREIYGSDEFRTYDYKTKRCPRMYSHDWTNCPYTHHDEKAERRDPHKHPYIPIICPGFRDGVCLKGDNCQLAHGVFEYWMHPNKYRTRVCTDGRFCTRKVCFFAHSPDQLRFEPTFNSPKSATKGKMIMSNSTATATATTGDHELMMMMSSGGEASSSTSAPMQAHYVEPSDSILQLEGVRTLLESLRALKKNEDEARKTNKNVNSNNSFFSGGIQVAYSDLPHMNWIKDILN